MQEYDDVLAHLEKHAEARMEGAEPPRGWTIAKAQFVFRSDPPIRDIVCRMLASKEEIDKCIQQGNTEKAIGHLLHLSIVDSVHQKYRDLIEKHAPHCKQIANKKRAGKKTAETAQESAASMPKQSPPEMTNNGLGLQKLAESEREIGEEELHALRQKIQEDRIAMNAITDATLRKVQEIARQRAWYKNGAFNRVSPLELLLLAIALQYKPDEQRLESLPSQSNVIKAIRSLSSFMLRGSGFMLQGTLKEGIALTQVPKLNDEAQATTKNSTTSLAGNSGQ